MDVLQTVYVLLGYLFCMQNALLLSNKIVNAVAIVGGRKIYFVVEIYRSRQHTYAIKCDFLFPISIIHYARIINDNVQ